MATKQTVYASELKPFTSVIGLFDGSEEFAIDNPFFQLPGCKQCDPKAWLNAIPDSKGGLFLNGPRLLKKNANKVFSAIFVIGWTSVVQNQKLKKEYRIHAPVAQETLKRKQKLMVSPGSMEIGEDDAKLILFEWQLTLAMDVMVVAKVLNINLNKYKGMSNEQFYHAYISDINTELKKLKAQTMIEYDEELVKSWTQPPIASKSKRKDDIFIYDITNPQDPAIEPLMSSFYESITSIRGKVPTFEPKGIERVWSRPNCFAIPSFKYKTYMNKQDPDAGLQQVFDGRLTFISLVPKTDKEYNPKFPENLCTIKQVSRTQKVKLTKEILPELWGATTYNPNPERHESAKHAGCIFLSPSLNFSFHEKGSPGLDWRVDTYALSRVVTSEAEEVGDAGDFMDESEQTSTSGGNFDEQAGAFAGNENEMDPDMLI